MSDGQPEQLPPFDFGVGFESFADRIGGERDARLAQRGKILSFGVHFLDAALGGILPSDIILIGARTGAGKTELSTLIAKSNAMRGRRVHYFALEAEDREIERRAKWQLLADRLYKADLSVENRERLSFMDWYKGDLDDIAAPFEAEIEKSLAETYRNLHTFYRFKDFNAEQMERAILAIQDETDLIVLDHLHFVDSDDPNENRGYKLIVKKLRDVALNIGKPVIVIAHLRKAERGKNAPIVPDVEDFHGTSDVPKIATKAIMLAKARDQEQDAAHLWPTYVAPVKCRFDGSRTGYVGLLTFNARLSSYQHGFDLGRMNLTRDKFELVDNAKMPAWARKAMRDAGEPPPTGQTSIGGVNFASRVARPSPPPRQYHDDSWRHPNAPGSDAE